MSNEASNILGVNNLKIPDVNSLFSKNKAFQRDQCDLKKMASGEAIDSQTSWMEYKS